MQKERASCPLKTHRVLPSCRLPRTAGEDPARKEESRRFVPVRADILLVIVYCKSDIPASALVPIPTKPKCLRASFGGLWYNKRSGRDDGSRVGPAMAAFLSDFA